MMFIIFVLLFVLFPDEQVVCDIWLPSDGVYDKVVELQ